MICEKQNNSFPNVNIKPSLNLQYTFDNFSPKTGADGMVGMFTVLQGK